MFVLFPIKIFLWLNKINSISKGMYNLKFHFILVYITSLVKVIEQKTMISFGLWVEMSL